MITIINGSKISVHRFIASSFKLLLIYILYYTINICMNYNKFRNSKACRAHIFITKIGTVICWTISLSIKQTTPHMEIKAGLLTSLLG